MGAHNDHLLFSLLRIVDTIDRDKAKTNAHKNPCILMPETNLSASIIIRTFITKRKRPSVTMVTGRVRSISKGLTIKLRIAKTNAKIIAVANE